MPKMIDSEKLLEWIEQELQKTPRDFPTSFECGRADGLREFVKLMESGTFDPTPPVQPDKYFAVSVKDEGFNLTSDEGEEVKYILINYNGKMEGYSDDMKEIEMLYGKVKRLTGEVIPNE